MEMAIFWIPEDLKNQARGVDVPVRGPRTPGAIPGIA